MNGERYNYWCELGLDGGSYYAEVSFDHEATQAEVDDAATDSLRQAVETAKLRAWGRA